MAYNNFAKLINLAKFFFDSNDTIHAQKSNHNIIFQEKKLSKSIKIARIISYLDTGIAGKPIGP
jgi:hypothetical protein